MAKTIKMPKLSDQMSAGVIAEWKKQEGDAVKAGDILAEVETDKALMELESSESGVLLKIVAAKGEKVSVGGTLAIVGEKGEEIQPLPSATKKAKKGETSQEYTDIPLSQMRETIAERMTYSKSAIPHFYITVEIDMQPAVDFRSKLKSEGHASVSFNDMVIRACALALKHYPEINTSFLDGCIRQHHSIHVAMAVAMPNGLITPVIRNADQKSLFDISAEVRELALRAKEWKLKPEDYTGSTFTTSNMGMFGVEQFSAIINPPNAAILAISAMQEKPVVEKGEIKIGKRLLLTLSGDHRAVDGASGARFLKEIKKLLENPELLVE